MKRTIVGLAVVAGVVALAAAPAQATSSTDPVKALQAKLARGKAVNIQSTAKMTVTSDQVVTSGLSGTIGFGPRGAVASDLEQSVRYSKALLRSAMKTDPEETEALHEGPIRMISSGANTYVAGPVVDDALPEGTSWVRYGSADLPGSNLVVETLEPATLKSLLANRTSWGDGVVKGSVRASTLAKVSPAFRAHFGGYDRRDGKIGYTLWFNSDGLVERVAAKAVLPFNGRSVRIESDTRFDDWGREATVLVPLRGEVIDQSEVKSDVPSSVPGIWS